MASVDIQTMKEKVASAYPGAGWKYRVYHQMKHDQIVALYFRFLQDGTFEKAKKRKKVEKENEKINGNQINIFDWIKSKGGKP